MDFEQAAAKLAFLPVRLRLAPQAVLKLPSLNKGNTLRGAFGTAFRRLVCIPQCRDTACCPLDGTCPYRVIFEPTPPPGADRLSKNHDIPRPFVFRAPLSAATTYEPGRPFDFGLTLIGKAVDYLAYFILAFREVAQEGMGLNRAQCTLEKVEQIDFRDQSSGPGVAIQNPKSKIQNQPSDPGVAIQNPKSKIQNPDTRHLEPETSLVYSSADQLFRAPQAFTLGDYVQARRAQLSLPTVNYQLSTVFLTPTYLKSDGLAVRQPEFHHLFKRVRDRLNALCTFYGPGPIEADFKGLGEAAERVRTVKCDVHWQERSRRSSQTGQRHELSGFTGECTYEFPNFESGILNVESERSTSSGISNLELLKWLLAGEILHAGRHTAWGNGWFSVTR